MFIKSVDKEDREKVGLLLETDEGLTTDWAVVKRVCSRFDKRQDSNNEGSSTTGATTWKKLEDPIPTPSEEMRPWLESGTTPINVAGGPAGGASLKELTRMVRDLQMAQSRRESSG